MSRCPICNQETTAIICNECGYNLEVDLMNHRFINKLSNEEINNYKKQIEIQRQRYHELQELRTNKEPTSTKSAVELRELGDQYYKGIGVEKDLKKAKEYYEQAVRKGDVPATLSLAIMYHYGAYISKDYNKAFELYNSVKDKSFLARKKIAEMYFKGESVETNVEKGLEIYNKVIEEGDTYGLHDLGFCYEIGCGALKKDVHKAVELYEEDVRKNNSYLSKCRLKAIGNK